MTGYVTAQRAAAEHGVSRRRMHQLLQQGRVPGAVKFGKSMVRPPAGNCIATGTG